MEKKSEFCCKSVLVVKMLVPFRYFFYFPFLTKEITDQWLGLPVLFRGSPGQVI